MTHGLVRQIHKRSGLGRVLTFSEEGAVGVVKLRCEMEKLSNKMMNQMKMDNEQMAGKMRELLGKPKRRCGTSVLQEM